MRKYIFTILSLLLTVLLHATTVVLYWIGGQSNAQGKNTPYQLFAPYHSSEITSRMRIFNPTAGVYQTLQLGVNNQGGGNSEEDGLVGAETSLAYNLAGQMTSADSIYIVKYAVGGTHLYQSGEQDWNAASSGELLDNLIARIQAAKASLEARGLTVIVKGLWNQGEADAWATRTAIQYQTDLQDAMDKIETTLGISNMPLVVVKTSSKQQNVVTADVVKVQTGQAAYVSANTNKYLLPVDNFNLIDEYHLGVDAQAYIGEQAATFLSPNGYTAPTFTSHGSAATAPTSPVLDDAANTLSFTLGSGHTLSQHEFSVDFGYTWHVVTSNPILLSSARNYDVGEVLVRVAQGSSWDASTSISNGIAFHRDVVGHIDFYQAYMKEFSANTYTGSDIMYSYLPVITTGKAVRFNVPNGDNYQSVLVGIGSAANSGNMAFRFHFFDNVVYCESGSSTTEYYEALIQPQYYRILVDSTNVVKWQKSTDDSAWTTMFTSASPASGSYYVRETATFSGKTVHDIILQTISTPPVIPTVSNGVIQAKVIFKAF